MVFMIAGFETAVFTGKAAILKIQSNRDCPDTVYVYKDPSGSTSHSPADSLKEAPHSAAVKRVRAATRRTESFEFNPNTVSVSDLQRLGFSDKQAQAIENYRLKGGRFNRKSDFAKSFVVADSIYRRLEKYISIPKVDINSADSATFDSLPGIGPYFASKMVQYRERLGGYSCCEQLLEIYRFDRERYDALSDLIFCGNPHYIDIMTIPEDSLAALPAVRSRSIAHGIILFRESHDSLKVTASALIDAGVISQEQGVMLRRCTQGD